MNKINPRKQITLKSLIFDLKYYLIFLIIFSTLANGLTLYIPKLIGQVIDGGNVSSLNILSVVILAFIIAILEVCVAILFSEKFALNLRIKTFNNLTNQPYQYVTSQGSSNIITIFNSDISNMQDSFTTSASYLLQAAILLIGSIALMFSTSWQLSIIAILALPVLVISFGVIFGGIGKLFAQSQANTVVLNKTVSENISGSMLIRVLGSFFQEISKYQQVTNRSKNISLGIVRSFSLLIPLISLITNMVTIAFLYYGGLLVQNNGQPGGLTVGGLTSFISYFALLTFPIFILGFASQGISQSLQSWKRVEPLLNAKTDEIDEGLGSKEILDDGKKIGDRIGNIKVVDLTLEYEGKKVLNNISFEIEDGQKTAIIGPTGAGKSQLLNLLIGLNTPTSGEISIGGKDIKAWNKQDLLSQVGIVFQESLIFNTTLEHNILLNRKASESDLKMAIETAQISDLEINLSGKTIEEGGASLSGGQKQRLTLARAIVSKPAILLLDDFTARVDGDTEKKIREALAKNYPNTQIIQICQKIESVIDYENIIVIMEGQILGQGKHEELLANCPEYEQIWKSQQVIG